MREHPIPFSAPMTRALLAGRKTQTRREVKRTGSRVWSKQMPDGSIGWMTNIGHAFGNDTALTHSFGKPGDQLWVREAWRADKRCDHAAPRDISPRSALMYEADGGMCTFPLMTAGKLRPAMFMCRWMSRIQLEVVDVRVERLQEISEADAIAEGIEAMRCPDCHLAAYGLPGWGHDELNPTAQGAYRFLWESINGAGSWDANPWVWVIEFRRAAAGVPSGCIASDGGSNSKQESDDAR